MVDALDCMAPARLTTFEPRAKPWITSELHDLMRARDRAYRTYRRRDTATSFEAYKHLRRLTQNRLDSAKNAHIARELASASSPGGYRRVLRRISVTARENPSLLKLFTPEELCTYYASVSLTCPPLTHDSVDVICARPLLNPLPAFYFRPVTSLDVQVAMQSCKSSSCGSNGIPATVMRFATQTIFLQILQMSPSRQAYFPLHGNYH
ncbi:hypothetical protein TKK_0009866 [Trichogramma kaykai]